MNRTRRLRKTENIRRLVRENRLSVDDLIYPLFIEEGENIETEIVSMPGIKRFSLDRISVELDEIIECDISAVLLFGIPKEKDEIGALSMSSAAFASTSTAVAYEWVCECMCVCVCVCVWANRDQYLFHPSPNIRVLFGF